MSKKQPDPERMTVEQLVNEVTESRNLVSELLAINFHHMTLLAEYQDLFAASRRALEHFQAAYPHLEVKPDISVWISSKSVVETALPVNSPGSTRN